MWRYIFRRTLQMIPTVFGVVLITFILFNLVGGSPARQVLGQHAQPETLEQFDEIRGFNKPLFPFFGCVVTTRAYADSDFDRAAGDWQKLDGVTWTNGAITLAPDSEFHIPLRFALRDDVRYELRINATPPARFEDGKILFDEHAAGTASSIIRFKGAPLAIFTGGTGVEIQSIQLRRLRNNLFDSQFTFYLAQLARLDFGTSHSTGQRVTTLLRDGIVPSLTLTVPVFFIGLITAVILSLFCAFWRDTWIDRFFVVISVALMSINYLVYIVAGQYYLGYKLGGFPVWGFESARYLILPVIIGVISGLGAELRFYRTIMLDEMHRDYVRTAQAKGVGRFGILFKHVLKNAMIPIVTNVVIAIPFLYTGSLLLESFFGIPGLGYLSINAINSSDVDVVRAIVLVGSVLFVIANLLVDICYALVDPRVKLK